MKSAKNGKKIVAVVAVCLVVVLACAVTLVGVSGGFSDIHVLSEAEEGQIRVACVGDSITYGCWVFDHAHNNYPVQLNNRLGKGYVVNNYGYSGRAAHSDTDQPYTKEKLYRKSLDFQPNVVVLMLGTNDTRTGNWHGRDAYASALGEIIDAYLALSTHPRVILMTPPPAFPFLGKVRYRIHADLIEKEVVPAVRALSVEKGLELIDLFLSFEGKSNLFIDGVHPNVQGAAFLADRVYETIVGGTESVSEPVLSVA